MVQCYAAESLRSITPVAMQTMQKIMQRVYIVCCVWLHYGSLGAATGLLWLHAAELYLCTGMSFTKWTEHPANAADQQL